MIGLEIKYKSKGRRELKTIKLSLLLICFSLLLGNISIATTIEKINYDSTILTDDSNFELAQTSIIPKNSGVTSPHNEKATFKQPSKQVKKQAPIHVITPFKTYVVILKPFLTPVYYEGGYLSIPVVA